MDTPNGERREAGVEFAIKRGIVAMLTEIPRIGRENDKWSSALGKYGIEKCNSNGELLLALCTEFDLIVTNTMFKQKDEHKTTWTHPRSRHGHMIDFIITRCRDKMDIFSTRTIGHLQYMEKNTIRKEL